MHERRKQRMTRSSSSSSESSSFALLLLRSFVLCRLLLFSIRNWHAWDHIHTPRVFNSTHWVCITKLSRQMIRKKATNEPQHTLHPASHRGRISYAVISTACLTAYWYRLLLLFFSRSLLFFLALQLKWQQKIRCGLQRPFNPRCAIVRLIKYSFYGFF